MGTYTITATFTPTDTSNYVSGRTVMNSITVFQETPTKVTPKLTWTPKPLKNIVYGTKLGYTPDGNESDAYCYNSNNTITRGTPIDGQYVYTDETGAVVTQILN